MLTDSGAFLKKLNPEDFKLTSQQEELLRFIEKNPDAKLVLRPIRDHRDFYSCRQNRSQVRIKR